MKTSVYQIEILWNGVGSHSRGQLCRYERVIANSEELARKEAEKRYTDHFREVGEVWEA